MKAIAEMSVAFINNNQDYESDREMAVAFINEKQELRFKC